MSEKLPGKRIVGAKQTMKIVKAGSAEKVYVAENAEKKVTEPVIEACKQMNVEIISVESMEKLGRMCGIDVGAAIACIIKE